MVAVKCWKNYLEFRAAFADTSLPCHLNSFTLFPGIFLNGRGSGRPRLFHHLASFGQKISSDTGEVQRWISSILIRDQPPTSMLYFREKVQRRNAEPDASKRGDFGISWYAKVCCRAKFEPQLQKINSKIWIGRYLLLLIVEWYYFAYSRLMSFSLHFACILPAFCLRFVCVLPAFCLQRWECQQMSTNNYLYYNSA